MTEKERDTNYLTMGQAVPMKEKLGFGAGVWANTTIVGVVSLYLIDFYVNIFKLKLEFFIIANIIYLIWNTLNDVVFGYYSDKGTHKLGRRLPYIRYGAPFFALSFIYFWFPLPGTFPGDINQGQWMKFFQLVSAFLFFDTALTIVILSFIALPPEMSESTEERTKISFIRTIFNLSGALTVLIVPTILSIGIEFFRSFIIILAILSIVAYVMVSYIVKERTQLHDKEEDEEKLSILQEFTTVFKNKAFISFIIFNFCNIYVQTMLMGFAPLIVDIFIREGIQVNATIILVMLYLGNLVSVPLFTILSNKIESRTMILWTSIACFVSVSFLFIIDLIFSVVIVYWGILIFDGLIIGLGLFYYPYMSDAVDVDELKTNQRREGMFFGMNALLTKPAENLPAIIGGVILLVCSYVQGGEAFDQPESAIFGLKMMVAVIPIILSVVLIISQFINPLKGEYYKNLKNQIIILHEKKEEKK